MSVTIKGDWLITKYGNTKHWDERDVIWLESGGVPYKNSDGYITLPYGNAEGPKTYPWRK